MGSVCVTGANGYIGQHCLKSLVESGYEVHAFVRSIPERSVRNCTWHKIDLIEGSCSDLFKVIRPSHLFHLAWCTDHGKYWNSMENYKWLESSKNMASDFFAHGGTRLVAAGTCAEYSWGGQCIEYVTNEVPQSIYGKCKKEFSDFLHTLNSEQNSSTAVGRIFHLYGPNEDSRRLIPYVIESLLNSTIAKCSDGRQLRDFMFIEDVAHGLLALLHSNVLGVVNIATGHPNTLLSLLKLLERLMHRDDQIQFGAISRAPSDPDELYACTKRLNREVGFYPQYSLESGLLKSIESIQNQLRTLK